MPKDNKEALSRRSWVMMESFKNQSSNYNNCSKWPAGRVVVSIQKQTIKLGLLIFMFFVSVQTMFSCI